MFTQIGSWFVDPIFFALPLFHKHLFNPFRWVSKNWFQYFNCLWQWKCGNTSALNMWIKILISIRLQYLFFKLEKFSDPVLWIFCYVINLYLIPKFICLCFLLTCPSTACTFMNEFTKFYFLFHFLVPSLLIYNSSKVQYLYWLVFPYIKIGWGQVAPSTSHLLNFH